MNTIAKLFAYVGGGAVIVMTLNILLNALSRTFFDTPIPGTLEYVQYWWMILIAFGGLSLAALKGEHIDAPILSDRLSARMGILWQIIAQVATIVFLAILVIYGWASAMQAASIGEYQGGYRTPIWPFRFLIPIALGAFSLVIVNMLVKSIVQFARFEPSDEDTNGNEAVNNTDAVSQ